MVKDDLCITVPSSFRCPISLDIMKSPVSLCTGVTYDRSSIQRWLDNGNNTCPATMQLLHTKDFTPNRTLHSLIQIWSDSVQHRLDQTGSKPVRSREREQVLHAIKNLDSHNEKNRFDSLAELARLAQHSEENRVFLSEINGVVAKLVGFLYNVDAGVEILERVVRVLGLVLHKIEDREGLKNSILKVNCFESLLLVLKQGSTDSRIASCRVLAFVAIDAESKLLIAENEGIVTELLHSASPEKDPSLIDNALRTLVAISTPKRNKLKLVKLGITKVLSKLLTESNSSISITEKVLKLVETASSTKEGRREICEDEAVVGGVLNKARKVSSVATEHAVATLWSLCYLFRDHRAEEAVVKGNGLSKILLVMQSNCSPHVRQMCVDLLKIFRVNSKSCIPCYETKTAHITPF